MMPYLLAIDAGTGSGRAVLFDLAGRQIGLSQEEWSHRSDPRYPGSMDFDCEWNWNLIARNARRLLQQTGINPAEIRAVSATSMREGIVLYDKEGRELWACANVDSRAGAQVTRLQAQYPGLEQESYRLSGQTFALGALPRLLWVREYMPRVMDRVCSLGMISDWVLYRLSGAWAADPSNAGTTGLFSLANRRWAKELLSRLDLPDDILPPVLEAGTPLGRVHARAAEETGLAEGTPVVMGGGDVQLGCVGLGVTRPGQVAVLGGTFWQQEVNLGEPLTDPQMDVRVNPHAVPGIWQAEAIVFFAGQMMRWFRDAFCQQEKEEARLRGLDAYAVMEQMAQAVPPGSFGIIPVFSDRMRYGNWYHAAPSILNLSLDPQRGGKAAIFRALQENAAIVAAVNLEQVTRFSGARIESLVFGGGAAKGPLWSQILADVTGYVVRVPEVKEATALGTALAAGVGVGIYADLPGAAESVVRWDKEYMPNPGHREAYDEARRRWVQAYSAQRALVDEGLTTSLWRAPGI